MNKKQEDQLLIKLHQQAIALRHARHALAKANNFIAWHTAGHSTGDVYKAIKTATNEIDKYLSNPSISETD